MQTSNNERNLEQEINHFENPEDLIASTISGTTLDYLNSLYRNEGLIFRFGMKKEDRVVYGEKKSTPIYE